MNCTKLRTQILWRPCSQRRHPISDKIRRWRSEINLVHQPERTYQDPTFYRIKHARHYRVLNEAIPRQRTRGQIAQNACAI